MHTRQSVADPQHKGKPASQPHVFEWFENRAEDGLSKLYRVDIGQRQTIVEIIRELEDSNMFWKLLARYEDASADKDDEGQHEALMALLARIYIAGSLRGCEAVDL